MAEVDGDERIDSEPNCRMNTAQITVATSRVAPGGDAMVGLATALVHDNRALDLRIVDVDAEPEAAVELGVMTCPALIVEAPGKSPVVLAGLRSHRAVLHVFLPLIYDDETALNELRRQLGSPSETFPRPTRRRLAKIGEKRRVEMLRSVPLFSVLSKRQLEHLARASHEVVLDHPATVVEEGAEGDEFFIVADGEAHIDRGGSHVATLKPGAHFGELSLLDDRPRSATVTTKGPTTLLAIDRTTFRTALATSSDLALALLAHLAGLVRDR